MQGWDGGWDIGLHAVEKPHIGGPLKFNPIFTVLQIYFYSPLYLLRTNSEPGHVPGAKRYSEDKTNQITAPVELTFQG